MIYSHLLSSFSLGESKARFNAIAEQLAQLSTAFTKNVLDATKAFSLLLTSPEQVLAPRLAPLSRHCGGSFGPLLCRRTYIRL
jgi:oligopeptidase A